MLCSKLFTLIKSLSLKTQKRNFKNVRHSRKLILLKIIRNVDLINYPKITNLIAWPVFVKTRPKLKMCFSTQVEQKTLVIIYLLGPNWHLQYKYQSFYLITIVQCISLFTSHKWRSNSLNLGKNWINISLKNTHVGLSDFHDRVLMKTFIFPFRFPRRR